MSDYLARREDVALTDAAELSKLLFEAREQIDMWADVVEVRTGHRDTYADELRERIDAYRERRGWNPNGFGDEET